MFDVKEIQKKIRLTIPEGAIVTDHNEKGHFYKVVDAYVKDVLKRESVTYPSVTGKLQVLKDPSIANFKMNRAMDYIFSNFDNMNHGNLMEHLTEAKQASTLIFEDAGHIGTTIHDIREDYFQKWIDTGVRPADIFSFIPEVKKDKRIVSALRAIDQFVNETGYIPVACELFVYSHKFETAGTLDDLGIMRWPFSGREGDLSCQHELIYNSEKNVGHCLKCSLKYRMAFVLMDLKTSNQFKDHYFFQVGIYYDMFKQLAKIAGVDLKIDHAFILKASKEDGRYKIEDLQSPSQIATYSKAMLRTAKGVEIIKNRRKDNQKTVIEI